MDGPLQTFRVRIVTWNVAQTAPQEKLTKLIECSEDDAPDMIAVGLQEMSLRSKPSWMRSALPGDTKGKEWVRPVKNYLYERGFVKLLSKRQFAMLLLILVKRRHIEHIRHIKFSIIRTGILGILGNKGAIIGSFRAYGATICIATSHLPAHEGQHHRRMEDYETIKREVLGGPGPQSMFAHNYVFWFGDLNFRIHYGIEKEMVRSAIRRSSIVNLIGWDEFNMTQEKTSLESNVPIMDEATVRFAPTFKFYKGTDDYDRSRKPAWTDRILYWCGNNPGNRTCFKVHSEEYRSHEAFCESDHKPVSGIYGLRVFQNYEEEEKVEFLKIDDWCCDSSQCPPVRFYATLATAPTNRDRIVLMDENFRSFKSKHMRELNVKPQNYDVDPKDESSRRRFWRTFRKRIEPGSYRFAYLRNYRDCLGLSNVFTVRKGGDDKAAGVKRNFASPTTDETTSSTAAGANDHLDESEN